MKHLIWTVIALGPLLGSCSAVPENHYFTMAYVVLPRNAPAPIPVSIRMRQFDIGPAYDQERLVYRYSPYEFQYYSFMLWAVKPQKMITDLLFQHLQKAGLVATVAYEFGEQRPDFEMSGAVQAIEELDSGDEWFAHLAYSVRLARYGDEKAVWSYDVDARKKVFNKLPVHVVKALSELMEEQSEKVLGALEKFLHGRGTGGDSSKTGGEVSRHPAGGEPAPGSREGDQ